MFDMKGILRFATMIALFSVASAAHADAILRLTQGSTVVEVPDGSVAPGAVDACALMGCITFIGPVGDFVLNISTGFTKPFPGFAASTTFARMNITSSNTSLSAGDLLIEFTDHDFPAFPSDGFLNADVSGLAGGVVTFSAYKDPANVHFGTGGTSIELGPFGPGPFAGSDSEEHGPLGPYSMTLVAEVEHGAATTSFFIFDVTNTVTGPAQLAEPGALALLGAGLLGFGWARRRQRSR